MANQFLDTNWVSMEVLRFLVNDLTVAEYFNSDWEKDFKQEFAVGSTIQVKFPQSFTIRDGLDYSPQGINRIATTIAVDEPFGSDFEWDDYEYALKAERSEAEIREQYLEPLGAQLAQEWDSRAALWAKNNTSNVVGVLGTDATAVNTYYQARRRLKELAVPKGKKCFIWSSSMMQSLGQNITTLFQPGDEIAQAFKEGYLGRLAGFDVFESNSIYSHTAGTWASSVTVNGANQSGTALAIICTAGDTFNQGDKFSIANVNAVNPRTRRIAGPATAKNFVVTQNLVGLGNGNAADVLQILPAIYAPGSQYQNVDSLPANAAALTLWPGTSSPNGKVGTVGLALSKQAFAIVGMPLKKPKYQQMASVSRDEQTGIPVRMVFAWDPVHSMNIHRADTVGGFGNLYQDNGALAIAGA
jgi:hypothetical protein